MNNLKIKLKESLGAVMPITAIVFIFSIILVPLSTDMAMLFLVGAALLIFGMSLFQLGAEMAMSPLGEGLGVKLSKSRNVFISALISFVLGVIITLAEPDLQVLANQVPNISNWLLIITTAVGVGIFLMIAIMRIIFKISLSKLLLIFYGIVFIVAVLFVPKEFLSVAFDAGGVTTGPITVPFILAIGVGITSMRSDKDASNDSFGLVALSSLGPILAVLILGIFFNPEEATYTKVVIPSVPTTQDVLSEFMHKIPAFAKEVIVAVIPILVMFVLIQITSHRYKKRQLARMAVGFLYTITGLILFLVGVNVGFMPVGQIFGSGMAQGAFKWLLIPLGMVIGYFIVKAEPAVQVLNAQVEEVTNGAIPKNIMNRCLSVGVAISVGLSMLRVLTGIPILWILIPGYIISLALTFVVPKIFVGIAFDSGGVCSGPMTTTFLLPLAMGACEALGGNVMTDAFGVVAFVAMTPLIAVQFMGVVYVIKERKAKTASSEFLAMLGDAGDIILFDEEGA